MPPLRGCRIFVGLQEGKAGLLKKRAGKGRKGIRSGQALKGIANGLFHGRNQPQPFAAVLEEKIFPAVKHGGRDEEGIAEAGNRFQMQKVLRKYPEDEEQAVGTIGDEGIRQDGMGATAGADDAGDPYVGNGRPSRHEVHDKAVVVSVNAAAALTSAGRADLSPGNKPAHAGFKKGQR